MPSSGEFALIRWIREQAGSKADGFTKLAIGDDCAILEPPAGCALVVTTDMLMDGRHFVLSEHGAEAVGRKAMGVNLSDIAAMAAIPRAAFVAVALPRGEGRADAIARALHRGIAEMANRFEVILAGGDTNSWDGPLVICVTLVGSMSPGARPILRSGAQPGDVVYVTGPLGGSILGRHMTPQPRIAEALELRERFPIHALIDISDGLAADLGHILDESGNLGALLEAEAIPIHPDATVLSAKTGRNALDHALHDGEDFELCVVLDPDSAADVDLNRSALVRLIRVGTIVAQPGLRLRHPDGREATIETTGFDHLKH